MGYLIQKLAQLAIAEKLDREEQESNGVLGSEVTSSVRKPHQHHPPNPKPLITKSNAAQQTEIEPNQLKGIDAKE